MIEVLLGLGTGATIGTQYSRGFKQLTPELFKNSSESVLFIDNNNKLTQSYSSLCFTDASQFTFEDLLTEFESKSRGFTEEEAFAYDKFIDSYFS